MTNQEMLDNFVKATHGKGRAMDPRDHSCVYMPTNDHPGCAMGCQPGFRAAMKTARAVEGRDADVVLLKYKELLDPVFGITDYESREKVGDFLLLLQKLHDIPSPWTKDGKLVSSVLAQFCKDNGLIVPKRA